MFKSPRKGSIFFYINILTFKIYNDILEFLTAVIMYLNIIKKLCKDVYRVF
jgi:hypothetical protein